MSDACLGKFRLRNTALNFKGGKIRLFIEEWEELTSDETILGYVRGITVPIDIDMNNLPFPRNELNFSYEEKMHAKKKIYEFVEKEVIEKVLSPENDSGPSVISNFFLRPKPDGDFRFILNLKPFNELIDKVKFKLTSLRSAVKMISKDMYFAKIDFKDGYFSLPIDEESKRFFRFMFGGELYQFCSLPQGYRDAVRIFTKVLKPALAKLRAVGHLLVNYIDDTLLMGLSYEDCERSIRESLEIFDKLGYTINVKKSILYPTRIIEFLGFILDSENMWVKPTEKRAQNLRECCHKILANESPTIRQLAEVIGKFVAMTEGNKYGPLYIKRLEILRNACLKKHQGNYEAHIVLDPDSIEDIHWWIKNVDLHPKPIHDPPFTSKMYTDASGTGFGVDCGGRGTNGLWNEEERECHINYQELLAIKLGLQTNFDNKFNEHIQCFTDSTVAVSCISKFGSCKTKLNGVTRDVWLHCRNRNNFITASHIAGKHNVVADKLSREHDLELEWKLDPGIFYKLNSYWGPFDIDLFASRINFQMKPYASWRPDPDADIINAFHCEWSNLFSYCFPPFPLVPRILQKLKREEAEMCIVVPFWKNQPFFSLLGSLLMDFPFLLSPSHSENILFHPIDRSKEHPLKNSLNLIACRLSGKTFKTRVFLDRVQNSSLGHGDEALKRLIATMPRSGLDIVWRGTSIPVLRL